jgi:hypothetical protein
VETLIAAATATEQRLVHLVQHANMIKSLNIRLAAEAMIAAATATEQRLAHSHGLALATGKEQGEVVA